VTTVFSACPASQLRGRTLTVICNSLENAGSPLLKVRVDGNAPVIGASGGTLLAPGQCASFMLQSNIQPLCIADTPGTQITTLECVDGTVDTVRLAVPLVGMNFTGVSTITAASDAGIDVTTGAGGVKFSGPVAFVVGNSRGFIGPSTSGNSVMLTNQVHGKGLILGEYTTASGIGATETGGLVYLLGQKGTGSGTGGAVSVFGGVGGTSDGGVNGTGGELNLAGGAGGEGNAPGANTNIWGGWGAPNGSVKIGALQTSAVLIGGPGVPVTIYTPDGGVPISGTCSSVVVDKGIIVGCVP
jgi:hypothetical protein